MDSFDTKINRLRAEIAPIKTNWQVEEDLNPKFDFIIAKAQELIDVLNEVNTKDRNLDYALSFINHIPRFLTEIRSLNGDYIWTERSLNSAIEQLNSFLGDNFTRRVRLKII